MLVSTPCIKFCVLDQAAGLCRGCGRNLGEIAAWATMPETDRLAIMATLSDRLSRMHADGRNLPAVTRPLARDAR